MTGRLEDRSPLPGVAEGQGIPDVMAEDDTGDRRCDGGRGAGPGGGNGHRREVYADAASRDRVAGDRGSTLWPVLSSAARVARRGVAAVVVPLLALLVSAPAASAHALLLRTSPSPQTTVAVPPAVVRLVFSESVEVTFGAVRVFDVDGHRVDSGRLTRTDGNREVDAATPHLSNGTYTVTWRVVSADGHPVHGGFTFYVGAPSTISAAAVRADAGAGKVIGWGFGVVRFAWFVGLLVLVGTAAIRRWVWTPAVRDGQLADSDGAARFRQLSRRALVAGWVLLVVGGLASLVFEAASVSGLSLSGSLHTTVLSAVLHTAYGHYWVAAMVAIALALVPVVGLARRRGLLGVGPDGWLALLALTTVAVCAAMASSGHARTGSHPAVAVVSIAMHLMAVAIWVGGLGVLIVMGGVAWRGVDRDARPRLARDLLVRFSRIAVVAAGLVVLTGTLNAVLALASVSDLWRITYGRVVLAKVVLVLVALAFGGYHRWKVPGQLADGGAGVLRRFQRTGGAELVVMLAALGLAAALVVLIPGRSLAKAANGPVNVERKVGPDVVQFFLDPSEIGANQVHLSYVDAQGLTDGSISQTGASIGLVGQPATPLSLLLISPGHFVGDATLSVDGRYRLEVQASGPVPSTTFVFRLHSAAASRQERTASP